MLAVIAALCFVGGALAFTYGLTTEYRQSREDGPVAIVATLPFGVAAALLLTMGAAAVIGRRVPIWAYVLLFLALTVACGYAITAASARHGS